MSTRRPELEMSSAGVRSRGFEMPVGRGVSGEKCDQEKEEQR